MEIISTKKRRIILAVGISFAVLGLYLFRNFVLEAGKLILLASSIAFLLSPLCALYEKRTPTAIAAVLSLLTALLIAVIALTCILIPIINSITNLYSKFPVLLHNIRLHIPSTISDSALSQMPDNMYSLITSIFTGIINFVSATADIGIALVIAWYMLTDRERLALRLELVIPSVYRQTVMRSLSEARLEIMLYLRSQSIIAICVGLLSALGLFIIGIDNAFPLGMTAGILNMIPYLGPIIACIPVGIAALTHGFILLLLSIAVLIAVQQIDGLILSPRIVGSSTGFPPSVIMISIFAAGAVWGIAGMLLILPAMILIRTCFRVFVELSHNC